MHAHYAIDTVKIVSVDRVLTLNVAHQTAEAWWKGSLRLKEVQRRLESEKVGDQFTVVSFVASRLLISVSDVVKPVVFLSFHWALTQMSKHDYVAS